MGGNTIIIFVQLLITLMFSCLLFQIFIQRWVKEINLWYCKNKLSELNPFHLFCLCRCPHGAQCSQRRLVSLLCDNCNEEH